jgi:hypothetical protein
MVVLGAPDPETELNPGVAVISSECLHRCEGGGWRECHIGINVIHIIINARIFINHFNIELKTTLV